jgi:nuclear receptor interaction protein
MGGRPRYHRRASWPRRLRECTSVIQSSLSPSPICRFPELTGSSQRWSRDGSLLASGSDDTRVNIYKANAGFSLNTQIETGHTQNIFSLKFMPHSGDRTIVTAAGDTQVRVFDIEYAPTTYTCLAEPAGTPETPPPNPRRRRGFRSHQQPVPGKIHDRAKRVYTSHTDRVKRIVTEDSPHLFLTCSEDGTVRQFDLRQPSEFYARPGASVMARPTPFGIVGAPSYAPDEEDDRNPPLISYRRHEIELNTISCSTSQPHYIAVGGSHLYCFLHDRRMLGRDRMKEAGKMYTRIPLREEDDGSLAGATKCVRRFAPRMGQNWDRRIQNSHVTSCKISDAYPDELLVSWSGDGVYLFNIKHSPQPNEEGVGREPFDLESTRSRVRAKREHIAQRARKRRRNKSPTGSEDAVPGQSTRRICSLVVELRGELFGYASSNLLADTNAEAERKKSYDAALALAHTTLSRITACIENLDQKDLSTLEMLEMSRRRTTLHTERTRRSTLAKNRRRTRSFVIAALCVARALGGWVEGIGLETGLYELIRPGLNETLPFRYRFLNAVLAFVNAGLDGVKQEAELFYQEEAELLEESDEEGSPPPQPSDAEKMKRYLDDLERGVQPTPIRNVDTNEEIFDSEIAMLRAFRLVLQGSSNSEGPLGNAAKRFWGEKVARAVLMKEGEGIDFEFVEKAFEGEEVDNEGPEVRGEVSRLLVETGGAAADDAGDIDIEMGDAGESEDSEDEDEDEDDEDEDEDDDGGIEPEEGTDDEEDFWYQRRRNRRAPVEAHAPVWEHQKVYRGHCTHPLSPALLAVLTACRQCQNRQRRKLLRSQRRIRCFGLRLW